MESLPNHDLSKPEFLSRNSESVENVIERIVDSVLDLEQEAEKAIRYLDTINDQERKLKVHEILRRAAAGSLHLMKRLSIPTVSAIVMSTTYAAIDLDSQKAFADKGQASRELEKNGITSDQRFSAYKPGLSELIYRGVKPRDYQEGAYSEGYLRDGKEAFLPELFSYLSEQGLPNTAMLQDLIPNVIDGRSGESEDSGMREDAWRIYLGLPQISKTFEISDYKPSNSVDDKYYLKINDFWDELVYDGKVTLSSYRQNIPKVGEHFITRGNLFMLEKNIMGQFTIGVSEDEKGTYMYYYDLWDLNTPAADNPIMKGVGKPFEIYDRIYFDPVTYDVIK